MAHEFPIKIHECESHGANVNRFNFTHSRCPGRFSQLSDLSLKPKHIDELPKLSTMTNQTLSLCVFM